MKTRTGVVALLVAVGLFVTANLHAKWEYPKEWAFKAGSGKVMGVVKNLPKTMPLKAIKGKAKGKSVMFTSDFGSMDIPKDITITVEASGKGSLVRVDGAAPTQSYKILREIGDKLKEPLPDSPKKHRS